MKKKDAGGKWTKAGVISVDSGQVTIGDACYFGLSAPRADTADVEQLCHKDGRPGKAIAVTSGYGDGVYPVMIRHDSSGRVAELRVTFIEEAA